MTRKEKVRQMSKIVGKNLFDDAFKEVINKLFGTEQGESEDTEEQKVDLETDTDELNEMPTTHENAEASEPPIEESEEQPKEAEDTEGMIGDAEEANEETNDSEDIDAEEEQDGVGSSNLQDELFDAKLEAQLLRANVREDKIEAAKKLFKADYTIDDINKVEKFIKDYPEWTKQKAKEQAKPFGVGVGEHESDETAEEREARRLGLIK